jgi:hypothetical protein
MTTAQLCILAYAGINASVIIWFFVLEPRRHDREYERKLKEINESTN